MSPGDLAAIVLPVFAFIAIGVVLVRLRLVGPQVGDTLGEFVFTLAVPLLIFRSVGTLALPDLDVVPFWASYFAAAAVNLGLSLFIAERVFGTDATTGVTAFMSATFSNLMMLGVPIMGAAFGEEGLVLIFLIIAVHLPIMMSVSAIMVEIAAARAGGQPRPLEAARRVAVALGTNPIIIAILCGFAFRTTGLPLTGGVRDVVDQIADTSVPLALIALGISLNTYGVRGNLGPAAVLSALKLVLMPLVVLIVATRFSALPPFAVAVLVLSAACPTGINAYLFGVRYRAGLALAASTITLSTAASLATLSAWLWVLG